eukprot:360917-Chlamydomonas_euryale.AAC.5
MLTGCLQAGGCEECGRGEDCKLLPTASLWIDKAPVWTSRLKWLPTIPHLERPSHRGCLASLLHFVLHTQHTCYVHNIRTTYTIYAHTHGPTPLTSIDPHLKLQGANQEHAIDQRDRTGTARRPACRQCASARV